MLIFIIKEADSMHKIEIIGTFYFLTFKWGCHGLLASP